MSEISIERPTPEQLESLGVKTWGPWDSEPKVFEWEYHDREMFYVLQGKVKITTPSGEVEINKGDLVTCPKGLKCNWNVIETIHKVYKFG